MHSFYVAATMPIGGPHSLNFIPVSSHTARALRARMSWEDTQDQTGRFAHQRLMEGEYARVMDYELFSSCRRYRSLDLSWSSGTGVCQRHHRLG